MIDATRARLFANQDDRLAWEWNNCRHCEIAKTCDLNEAIASASMLDGTVSADVAARLDAKTDWDGRTPWWCPERKVSQ